MRPERQVVAVEHGDGEGRTEGFGIDQEDLGKILGILADQLYSNEYSAVLREYSCNGVDAHIEAGYVRKKAVPLVVKLPTMLEPSLVIKDVGAGLDEEGVFRVYIRVGKSLKTKSNKTIGTFGLGAKSGFAVSDSFTVMSKYRNEDGTGECLSFSMYNVRGGGKDAKLLGRRPLKEGEETGITVTIPVKSEDIGRFQQEAQKVFRYFEYPLDFQGTLDGDREKVRVVGEMTKDLWVLQEDEPSVLWMGHVAYPFDDLLLEKLPERIAETVKTMSVMARCKIGEVSPHPSRERLNATMLTLGAVSRKFKNLDVIIQEYIKASVNSAEMKKLPSKARRARLRQRFSGLGNMLLPSVDGFPLRGRVSVPKAECLEFQTVEYKSRRKGSYDASGKWRTTERVVATYKSVATFSVKAKDTPDCFVIVDGERSQRVPLGREKDSYYATARYINVPDSFYKESLADQRVVFVRRSSTLPPKPGHSQGTPNPDAGKPLSMARVRHVVQRMYLDETPIRLLSSFPKKPDWLNITAEEHKAGNKKKYSKSRFVYAHSPGDVRAASAHWKAVEAPDGGRARIPDNEPYLRLRAFEAFGVGESLHGTLNRLRALLTAAHGEEATVTVYGIKWANKPNPLATSFREWARNQILGVTRDLPVLRDYLNLSHLWSHGFKRRFGGLDFIVAAAAFFDDDHLLSQLAAEITKARGLSKRDEDTKHIPMFRSLESVVFPVADTSHPLGMVRARARHRHGRMYKELYRRYPMAAMMIVGKVRGFQRETQVRAAVEYMKAMDLARGGEGFAGTSAVEPDASLSEPGDNESTTEDEA